MHELVHLPSIFKFIVVLWEYYQLEAMLFPSTIVVVLTPIMVFSQWTANAWQPLIRMGIYYL